MIVLTPWERNVGPIGTSEPVSIVKGAPPGPREQGVASSAHAAAPLGTLQSARSEDERRMWHDRARCGRAGQAFGFGEPGVRDRATANSLVAGRRGPPEDDQAVKTKLLTGSRLRILDQGLTANASPLDKEPAARTALHKCSTGSRVGWTSLPLTADETHFNGNTRSGR
jgi:hypothetical protein